MNQHISDYLEYYINLSIHPEFAVLIGGEWGSGKTWLINNYLDDKTVLYVSLYGLSSISAIDEIIFAQLHPVLSNKKLKLAAKVFKGTLKAGLKIDLNGDEKGDVDVQSSISPSDFEKYFKDDKKRIIIFDDFERAKIELYELFGYINGLLEQIGSKVIILCNENEIVNSEKEIFNKLKEKCVGKSFTVKADFNAAINSFVSQLDENQSKQVLKENLPLIGEVFSLAGYNNLRHVHHSVHDFNNFYSQLPAECCDNPELTNELLYNYFVFSFEIFNGAIGYIDLRNIPSLYDRSLKKYLRDKGDSSYTPKPIDGVLEKYSVLQLSECLESDIWYDYFTFSKINKVDFSEYLKRTKYFKMSSMPSWRKQISWTTSIEEMKNNYEQLIDDLKNFKFRRIGEVLHTAGALFFLSEKKCIKDSKRVIFVKMKLYVRSVIRCKLLTLSKSEINVFLKPAYDRVGFGYDSIEGLSQFRDWFEARCERELKRKLSQSRESINALLAKDCSSFIDLIAHQDASHELYGLPILSFIEPAAFIDYYILNYAERLRIESALEKRYRYKFTSMYTEEESFLNGIISVCDGIINKVIIGFEVMIVSEFKRVVLKIIENHEK